MNSSQRVRYMAPDPAIRLSDGPVEMPNWRLSSRYQTSAGWIDGIHFNRNNIDDIVIATRTSGFFKSTDAGQNWTCVTDNLPSQFMAAVA